VVRAISVCRREAMARAISVCRKEAMALKEENHAVVVARAEALALCLNEGVLTDAKLGGFNSYCGMLCATRMLTSFLLMLLSWGDVRVAAEVGWSTAASGGGGTSVMMHEFRRATP
jgi:hypothetical protein